MVILILFCLELLIGVLMGISVTYPLLAGLVLFTLYGKFKGFTWRELFSMMLSGVKTIRGLLIVFMLIGILTGLWRGCGTIPYIICCAVDLITPGTLIVMSFLLCCAVSVLTGTAFGTAATMGTICVTVAISMGMDPVPVGGAVFSGIYFGDRCSPVSTSALLISELTGTELHKNIRLMVKCSLVPFAVTCAIYVVLGLLNRGGSADAELWSIFGNELRLHWLTLIPAALIIILSLLRVNVKWTMGASILVSAVLCVLLQRVDALTLLKYTVMGYTAGSEPAASMLNGGGLVSMLRVACIVCISSAYSGIFKRTGLLDSLKTLIMKLGKRTTPYAATLVTAILSCMIACNQTLTVMLTHQLCDEVEPDRQREAINLENSAILVAPMIPWCISYAVPLASIGAPGGCIFMAFYLFLVPIWSLIRSFADKRRKTS